MKNCYSPAEIDPPVAAALPADVAATVVVLPAVAELPPVTPAVDEAIVDDAAPVPTAAVLAGKSSKA